MSNRVTHDSVNMEDGNVVKIEYWSSADMRTISLAGFNENGEQVTATTYSAKAELSDNIHATFKESLIETLTKIIKEDLTKNPGLHYRP